MGWRSSPSCCTRDSSGMWCATGLMRQGATTAERQRRLVATMRNRLAGCRIIADSPARQGAPSCFWWGLALVFKIRNTKRICYICGNIFLWFLWCLYLHTLTSCCARDSSDMRCTTGRMTQGATTAERQRRLVATVRNRPVGCRVQALSLIHI